MDSSDKTRNLDNADLEKSTAHIIVEIIEYVPNSVVIKTIIKKSTGNISIMSFDSGEGLTEKTSPLIPSPRSSKARRKSLSTMFSITFNREWESSYLPIYQIS